MATLHDYVFHETSPNGDPGPWTMTSVVCSDEEFENLILVIHQMSRATEIRSGSRISDEQIAALKDAKHIPLMARGTLTQSFFDMFGVPGNYMSVIVRGEGPRVAAETFGTIGEA